MAEIPDSELDIKIRRKFCSYYGFLEEEYQYYEGTDDNGKPKDIRHGYYHSYSSDNPSEKQQEFQYRHDKLHGYQREHEWGFEQRLDAEGGFDNGVPVGEHKSYSYIRSFDSDSKHEHRETRVGTFVDGVLHGIVQEFLDDGTVVAEAEYDRGVMQYMWSKDSNTGYKYIDRVMMLSGTKKFGKTWDGNNVSTEWEGTDASIASTPGIIGNDDEVQITMFKDYDVAPNKVQFLRTHVEYNDDGICTSAETYFPDGSVHEKFFVVPNPHQKTQTQNTNHHSISHSDRTSPGVPWFASTVYLPENYRHHGLQRIEYYQSGAIRMANMMSGRNFIGEFRYYSEDGELLEHAYYSNGKDVTDDMLEVADCDSLDDIDEDAEVYLTLQYGSLMLVPKELLCPRK